jgi:hypothetical protein
MFVRSSNSRSHPIAFGCGLEVQIGWLALIDQALDEIAAVVRRMPLQPSEEFVILQIKEKYAELRIYTHGANNEIESIIKRAEELSRKTCEMCGAFGMTRKFSGWFHVLCARCARGFEKRRGVGGDIVWPSIS